MSRKILGIDIRHDEISAVLVENSVKGNFIQSHIHIPLEIDPEAEEETHFQNALETLIQTMDIENSVSIVSLPAEAISYRNLHVPFRDQKKIRQILPFELEANLPYPVDTLELDFQILSNGDHDDEGAHILAAAVEKQHLESCKDVLSSFKIDPQSVAVGGFQTIGCVSRFSDMPLQALFIDIDARKSTVFAIVAGQVKLIRSFSINPSSKQPGKMLCTKIIQTISASEEILGSEFEPEAVYLIGSGIEEYPYDDDIKDVFQLPVTFLNLLRDTDNIPITGQPDASWDPKVMDNALALCLSEISGISGFNFSKRMFAAKKYWMANKESIIKTSAFLGVVLVLLFVNIFLDYRVMGKTIAGLDTQMRTIFTSTFPGAKIVDPLKQMQAEVKKNKENASATGETERSVKAIDILYDVSTLLPEKTDVEIKRFVIGPENVQISGNTDTFNSVDDMKNRLEKGTNFKKVTISSSKKDNKANRISFKLKIDL
ncbi:MAG: pilus assembly protein PilM [Desulfobacula sp.]|nr:pilus assembly protein PilM [Desulfobacula sp.]